VKLAGEISDHAYGRGNADAAVDLINDDGTVYPANLPLRSSDHDGLVLYISKDEDADGVPNDNDVCPATEIPEGAPSSGRLGKNKWALDGQNGTTFTQASPQAGSVFQFTTGDTGGCSCEQIVAATGAGQAHLKNGCSTSVMLNWVESL
jgi:hypothetical protein